MNGKIPLQERYSRLVDSLEVWAQNTKDSKQRRTYQEMSASLQREAVECGFAQDLLAVIVGRYEIKQMGHELR